MANGNVLRHSALTADSSAYVGINMTAVGLHASGEKTTSAKKMIEASVPVPVRTMIQSSDSF